MTAGDFAVCAYGRRSEITCFYQQEAEQIPPLLPQQKKRTRRIITIQQQLPPENPQLQFIIKRSFIKCIRALFHSAYCPEGFCSAAFSALSCLHSSYYAAAEKWCRNFSEKNNAVPERFRTGTAHQMCYCFSSLSPLSILTYLPRVGS